MRFLPVLMTTMKEISSTSVMKEDTLEDFSKDNKSTSGTIGSVASSLDSLCPTYVQVKNGGSISSEECTSERTIGFKSSRYSSSEQKALAGLCINTIRFLCIDAINNAGSGHPGICMGMAPAAFVLFDNHLKFNPSNAQWLNRDRFVLSAGHGSMLLYALLFLYGYDSVTLDDIKSFRKLNSKTPGHPECTLTAGVEVCTGPLGQGICNAVGIAISEAHLASVYSRPGHPVVGNYTYCIVGDGCLMEGMSAEACSLAGHLKLGKLIVLYDDNNISIDGSTDLAFTEDVSMRFQSYGWQILHVQNGNDDIIGIDNALDSAKQCIDRPTLIKISTTIGYGAPTIGNTAKAHGAALGAEETMATREVLNYEYEPFEMASPAIEHFRRKLTSGKVLEASWDETVKNYQELFPELYSQFKTNVLQGCVPFELEEALRSIALADRGKTLATRKHSKTMLNTIAPLIPSLLGGAADTSPSTLTNLDCSKDFTHIHRIGRNIRFGVREHAMGAIANGISQSGYNLRAFCSTFFVFSDYMRAAMRMAALSETGTIFIMTHDSIAIGPDGPSHQPIEHLSSLRAMPNHDTWRPADSVETGAAYSMAVANTTRPSTLVLSRQGVEPLDSTDYENAKRGGYVMRWDEGDGDIDGIIVATGSEVFPSIEAARNLLMTKKLRARVVSLPCWSEFDRQTQQYKKNVFCVGRYRTLSVEAGSSFGWAKYADYHVCVDTFGKSGDGSDVLKAFGITADGVQAKFLEMLQNRNQGGGAPQW